MVINVGAYATEIIRAGIESIHKGQVEAGLALGLKPLQVFRYIVLKPALKTVYPALTSQFILLMLSSSVVSAISADDLTSVANNMQSLTFRASRSIIVVTLHLPGAVPGLLGRCSRLIYRRRLQLSRPALRRHRCVRQFGTNEFLFILDGGPWTLRCR